MRWCVYRIAKIKMSVGMIKERGKKKSQKKDEERTRR
jgi:hypothetical protein